MRQPDFRLSGAVQHELHLGMENSPEQSASRWPRLLAFALILLAAWWGYRWVYPSYQPPVQPVPNGYDELVKLTSNLAPLTGKYLTLAEGNLAQTLALNKPLLAQARELLRRDCVVSLNWQANQQWFGTHHLKQIEKLKNLARAFAAEGMQAIREGDTRLAIGCGLENLHLAKAITYGGLGTDWLAGVAAYTVGLMTLRDACETATVDDCKFVLANLPDVRAQFEAPAIITEREWHFFRPINGVWKTFLTEMNFSNNRAAFERHMEDSLQVLDAKTELLKLHYLIRTFQLKEEKLPASLEEITTRDGFIYQVSGGSYFLYHVGLNGVDDGGLVNEQDSGQGDLVLEPHEPSKSMMLPAD